MRGAVDGVDDDRLPGQLQPVDDVLLRQRRAGADGGDAVLVEQRRLHRSRSGEPRAGDGDVEVTAFEVGVDVVAAQQGDRRAGGLLEPGDRLGDPGVGQDPLEAEPQLLLTADGLDRLVEVGEDGAGAVEEVPAGAGELHRSGGPFQQPHPEGGLQLLDGPGERGLADQQLAAGCGEGAVGRDRDERPQVPQLHIHACGA